MTSLHATLLAAAYAAAYDAWQDVAMATTTSTESRKICQAIADAALAEYVAWLADPATTTHAAQAHHEADLGGHEHLIRRFGWESLQPAVQEAACRKMRAALGAITEVSVQ